MGSLVFPQFVTRHEALVALAALVRFVARVRPAVDLRIGENVTVKAFGITRK